MPDLIRPLAIALAIGLAAPAVAQEAGDGAEGGADLGEAAPGDDLSLGQPADEEGPGSAYIDEEYDDWQVRCYRNPEGEDPCELFQLLEDSEGFPVAEISMIPLPEGARAAAGATIVAPLETLLTEAVTFRIDDGSAKQYPFRWCNAVGCVAQVGFTADELQNLKGGAEATITVIPAAQPDETVNVTVSLIGFTDAFSAVEDRSTPQQ